MSDDLKTLAQHREALLLAEAAAWLHDDFKHTDGHIDNYVTGSPSPSGRQDTEDLISSRNLSMLGKSLSFSVIRKRKRDDFVKDYLNRCHYTAHIEKQDGDGGPQAYPAYLSSPFGYEDDTFKIPTGLTADLRTRIPWNLLGHVPFTDLQRAQLGKDISKLFARVGGDTRRPANEITLWEWGHTVGALYKSALAGVLLGFQPQANDLRWCLLSVRFDGLAYFTESHRLPDLLARRELLDDALDNIQELLEVTYPLGTEVYRDENGSVFVVPGCEKGNCGLDVLALTDNGKSLQQLISDQVRQAIAEERVPKIKMDEDPWWGQDPQRHGNDELPPLAEHLSPAAIHSNPDWVAKQWQGRSNDLCTVCGLRPQGPSSKSQDRGVCDTCERRRNDRSETWATQNVDTTIWTDEVADTNGRLALIMGRFDLTGWLNGSLVQTLTVVDPANASSKTADDIAKNPSFARIRRIWETTRAFWQEVLPTDEDGDLAQSLVGQIVAPAGPRLEIVPQNRQRLDLGHFHTYELVLPRGVRLSMVWDSDNQRFITCDNLDYLAKPEQLGKPVQDVLSEGRTLTVEEPIGYGGKNKVWGEITLAENAQELPGEYTPAIPILAEPRTFMALVPADKALDVIQAIKQKYEREMGKVRNRLTLHLGAVYFHRRTPLRAALDAGRRMLTYAGARDSVWTVKQDAQTGPLPNGKEYLVEGTQQFTQTITISLAQDSRSLTWRVPAVMGDGATPDAWYPYVYVEKPAPEKPIKKRTRRFKSVSPPRVGEGAGEGSCWLVHAGELKAGDMVYFAPATFDFEYLDTTARRFEVSYKDGRRRGADKAQRPYLLDDLAHIADVWKTLDEGLSTSQIKGLETLIESKRRDWEKPKGAQALALPDDDPFRQLCCDALANAEWRDERWKESKDLLVCAAVSGMLADALELHLAIAKESRKQENEEAN